MEVEGPASKPSSKYDDLLTPASTLARTEPLTRATASYTLHDDRFQLQQRVYDRQFAQLYFYRLLKLRPAVSASAKRRWPSCTEVRVIDAVEDVDCVLVGTLYKEMKLKPSILDEYVKDKTTQQHLGRTRFTSPDDKLVLEDEGARIVLTGPVVPTASLVTGVVASVRGRILPSGEFCVSEICYAELGAQPVAPPPLSLHSPGSGPQVARAPARYIALTSGLGIGDAGADPLPLQLMVDYLTGALGGREEQTLASGVVRMVIAGGLLASSAALARAGTYADARTREGALAGLRDADAALSQLAAALPLDVMPGEADPANASLPQQALHRALLPWAAAAGEGLVRASNPHEFDVEGVRFLGLSGQNVDDVVRYAELDDRTEVLEWMLRWRHMAPTSPDTLAAYPFHDRDPFVLDTCPHVFFAGNQPEFGTRMVTGEAGQRVRVVSVPAFSASPCLVLVNLDTLACHPIYFNAESMDT
ncbi:POLD2 [Auxenochlorella protothecoides x Auxenochlorella symbiontica]